MAPEKSPTENTTIPKPDPAIVPPAAEVPPASESSAIADGLNRLADRMEKLENRAEQTPEAAAKAEADNLRERHDKGGAEAKTVAEREMEALEARHKRELDEVRRRSTLDRTSNYSLPDAMSRIEEGHAVCRDSTRQFWGGLERRHAGGNWNRQFEGIGPVEVLLRGSWEKKEIRTEYGGKIFSVNGVGALTAGADDQVLREAQDAMDALHLWTLCRQMKSQPHYSIQECPFYDRYAAAMTNLGKALPTLDRSSTVTTMANWVPTGFSARIIERFELNRNLLRFLPFFQMSQSPERIGRRGTYLIPRKVIASSSNAEDITPKIAVTDPAPGLLTLLLHEFYFRLEFDVPAEEDTIPSLAPDLVNDVGRSWAYAYEDAILNSSDAVIPVPGHIDVDVTSTTSYLNTWQGLRPEAIAQSYTRSLATFNADTIISLMQQDMGKWASNPLDLICIVGPKVKSKLAFLKDSSGNPVIHGAASPSVPVPSGVRGIPVSDLNGSPLIVVEAAREDLNSSGFADGTTATQGALMWVNTNGWTVAARSPMPRVFVNFDVPTAHHQMGVMIRSEFEDMQDSSAERTVNLGIDISFT